jgi:hypothetical protein
MHAPARLRSTMRMASSAPCCDRRSEAERSTRRLPCVRKWRSCDTVRRTRYHGRHASSFGKRVRSLAQRKDPGARSSSLANGQSRPNRRDKGSALPRTCSQVRHWPRRSYVCSVRRRCLIVKAPTQTGLSLKTSVRCECRSRSSTLSARLLNQRGEGHSRGKVCDGSGNP